MSTQAKKPEIRFAGFKDEWAKKKFDDVFDMLSNNTLSRDALNSEAGAAKNIHYGDVLTKFGEYIDVSIEKLPFISDPAIATKFIRSHLKDGDIVITDTAEDETVGKCTEVISVEEMPIIAGLHTMPCRPKEKYAPKYMGYYLNSHKYHNNLFPLMQGVKVTSISRTGVKETEVILSTEFDEQEKIGKHLSSLDNMIALETAKYEKLVIVKKAMLEKMFPKEGCDVPEIRFTGFTEAWEQRKLGDVAEFNPKAELPDKFEYVDLESVVGTGMIAHREETKVTAPSRAQRLAKQGDLFYQTVRPYQRNNYLFDKPYDNYVFSTGYAQMRPLADGYFLLSLVQNDLFVKSVLDRCTGTSYPAINSNDLANMIIYVPSKNDEQNKIGAFIKRLDDAIVLHQRKLEKLKNIKSACMEKMFV